MIPAVLLMALVFNGGAVVAQKTKLQNTADTAALTEAAWTARTLNLVAMNNTGMAQSHAIASSAWALEGPLYKAMYTSKLIQGFYGGRIVAWTKQFPNPIVAVVAAIVFGAMALIIQFDLHNNLDEVKKEIERAIHQDEGSFARAAAALGTMNELLVKQSPASVDEYSKSLVNANYEGATLIRYSAFAPNTPALPEPPLKELEIKDLIKSGESGAIKNKFNTVTDLKDLELATKIGTQKNPVNSGLAYLGNFYSHGYEAETGPFSLISGNITATHSAFRDKVDAYATGKAAGDALDRAACKFAGKPVPPNVSPPKCDCKWHEFGCIALKIIFKPIGLLFEGALGTIFEPTYEDDLSERLSNDTKAGAIEFSTWTRKSLYSKARFFQGIPLLIGFYNGTDFSNYGDTIKSKIESAYDDAINTAADDLQNEMKANACYQLKTAEITASRQLEYSQSVALANSLNQPVPEKPDSFEPSDNEKNEIKEDCVKEVESDPDKYQGQSFEEFELEQGTPVEPTAQDTLAGHNAQATQNDENVAQQNQDKWPYARDHINWNQENLGWLGGISLTFPLDLIAAAHPDVFCLGLGIANSFIPSGLCQYDTPLFVLTQQRLLPKVPGNGLLSSRKDWSVLVAVSHGIDVPMASSTFKDLPNSMTAVAQAEIYNTQWFDVFTQRWRAKLVPITLLQDNDYRQKITKEWKNTLDLDKLFQLTADPKQSVLNH